MARALARRARRSFTSLLWRTKCLGNVCDSRASSCYAGTRTSNVKGNFLPSGYFEPAKTFIFLHLITKLIYFEQIQAYGRELLEAQDWCRRYKTSLNVRDLNQAWDLYYHVFRRISRQLPQLTSLELQYVSPKLLLCRYTCF